MQPPLLTDLPGADEHDRVFVVPAIHRHTLRREREQRPQVLVGRDVRFGGVPKSGFQIKRPFYTVECAGELPDVIARDRERSEQARKYQRVATSARNRTATTHFVIRRRGTRPYSSVVAAVIWRIPVSTHATMRWPRGRSGRARRRGSRRGRCGRAGSGAGGRR